MEHDSSFNKQLRKKYHLELKFKKIKVLENNINEKNEKICDGDKENNTIQKATRRTKQKNRKYREHSSRLDELKNLKADLKNKIEALRQTISHIEEVKNEVKFKIKELKKKIESIPKENSFDFTKYVSKQKEDDEIDLSLFIELAEKKQDYIQLNTSKHFAKTYGEIEGWFFYKWLL